MPSGGRWQIEADVARHYGGRELLAAIEAGLAAAGTSRDAVTAADLRPVDEFHIGGAAATRELCDQLALSSATMVLDVGSGIGGAARFMASAFRCPVTGVDLTPEYVEVAETLTSWTDLDQLAGFRTASALDMPFDDASFDRATQLHVGMNIADKPALFTEVHRVVRPGGRFGVYDVAFLDGGELRYPVPWAAEPSTSFVADIDEYRSALELAGFTINSMRDRREFAIEFFEALGRKRAANPAPPPLGLHLLMGADTPKKLANMIEAIGERIIAPIEIVCEKPALG